MAILLFKAATDYLTPPTGTRPLTSHSAQQTIHTDVSECMSTVKSNTMMRLFPFCYHYVSLPKAPQSLTLPMAIVGSVVFLLIIAIVTLILAAIFTKRSGTQCTWDTNCALLFIICLIAFPWLHNSMLILLTTPFFSLKQIGKRMKGIV